MDISKVDLSSVPLNALEKEVARRRSELVKEQVEIINNALQVLSDNGIQPYSDGNSEYRLIDLAVVEYGVVYNECYE